MDAITAINKIKRETTTFMSQKVMAHPYEHQQRAELQKMAECGEISPTEYWKALKIVGLPRTESLRAAEIESLS
jgi:hypothetical protein